MSSNIVLMLSSNILLMSSIFFNVFQFFFKCLPIFWFNVTQYFFLSYAMCLVFFFSQKIFPSINVCERFFLFFFFQTVLNILKHMVRKWYFSFFKKYLNNVWHKSVLQCMLKMYISIVFSIVNEMAQNIYSKQRTNIYVWIKILSTFSWFSLLFTM